MINHPALGDSYGSPMFGPTRYGRSTLVSPTTFTLEEIWNGRSEGNHGAYPYVNVCDVFFSGDFPFKER